MYNLCLVLLFFFGVLFLSLLHGVGVHVTLFINRRIDGGGDFNLGENGDWGFGSRGLLGARTKEQDFAWMGHGHGMVWHEKSFPFFGLFSFAGIHHHDTHDLVLSYKWLFFFFTFLHSPFSHKE